LGQRIRARRLRHVADTGRWISVAPRRPRLANSLVLIVVTAVLSSIIGVLLGAVAAARHDKLADHTMSVTALVANSLPEFIVGVLVALVLAVDLHWESAGINRHGGGDGRALRRRASDPRRPRVMRGVP